MGHDQTEEIRDALVAELTEKHRASITEALAAGDAEMLHDVMFSWTEALAEDGVATRLVRAVFATNAATAGQALRSQLDKVVAAMAELAALKEAEQIEADDRDEADQVSIDNYTWTRAMKHLDVVAS